MMPRYQAYSLSASDCDIDTVAQRAKRERKPICRAKR
jgi:hypothetical protein